jgi:hypothetical protein
MAARSVLKKTKELEIRRTANIPTKPTIALHHSLGDTKCAFSIVPSSSSSPSIPITTVVGAILVLVISERGARVSLGSFSITSFSRISLVARKFSFKRRKQKTKDRKHLTSSHHSSRISHHARIITRRDRTKLRRTDTRTKVTRETRDFVRFDSFLLVPRLCWIILADTR